MLPPCCCTCWRCSCWHWPSQWSLTTRPAALPCLPPAPAPILAPPAALCLPVAPAPRPRRRSSATRTPSQRSTALAAPPARQMARAPSALRRHLVRAPALSWARRHSAPFGQTCRVCRTPRPICAAPNARQTPAAIPGPWSTSVPRLATSSRQLSKNCRRTNTTLVSKGGRARWAATARRTGDSPRGI